MKYMGCAVESSSCKNLVELYSESMQAYSSGLGSRLLGTFNEELYDLNRNIREYQAKWRYYTDE